MKRFLATVIVLTIMMSLMARNTDANERPIVYRLPIFSNINSTTWVHTQRAFAEAEELNAEVIIIHLNTYGGEVVFADSMRTKILNSQIPVHVFIDNNAASAGALISIACNKIFMRPGANIGAATVVNQSGEEMPDKYQSYMRSTIRATAEAHGKDTLIVGNDTIVKWIRDPRIAEAMVDERVEIPGIIEKDQVLTFTALEALENGFCDGIAKNMEDVLEQLGIENAKIVSFKATFYDNIKGFLTSPILRGFLILVILGGIYFEMQTPGIGFPIAAALLAAILYFAPLYIDGLAANWEIILFTVGILLIAVEIFVLPGFGVAGVTGIVFAVTGLVLSMLDNVVFDFSNVDTSAFMEAFLTVMGGIFGGFIVMIYLSNKLVGSENGPVSKIALTTSQDLELGYVSVDSSMKNLVGKSGITATVLRPSGKVTINDETYDARAVEGFVDKDEKILVTGFSSGQLNVRKHQ
ncbi:NfeD family protein [Alkaliflexus imshenetskii]|uniref:NfeD family protein n=1 Tax=Alkaliflexus imshenetskii TaxID=286730 RepID=UPI00047A2B06|nr:NfeD family protein [Alkaliflexus imshenetskii]